MNSNYNRIISCTILNKGNKIRKNYNSLSTIKEIKRNLEKQYSSEEEEKLVNLYHNGKELIKEDEEIGNICKNNDTLDLVMVSLTINESMINSDNKMKEKIISKLNPNCEFHNGIKDKYICITCGTAFCDECQNLHNNHKTIVKKEILNFEKDIKERKEKLIQSLKDLNLNDVTKDNEVFKEERKNLFFKCDEINEIVENIKIKYNNINMDFKEDFDLLFPFILEYKEKLNLLYEECQKETTIRLEKNFIDFYFKYKNLMKKEDKLNNQLLEMKTKIEMLKEIINDFSKRLESLYNKIKEEYLIIKDYNLENDNNDIISNRINKTFNFESPKSEYKHSRNASSSYTLHFGRMNLITLLSNEKEKKEYIKSVTSKFKDNITKKKSSSLSYNMNEINKEKIDEISESSETNNINLNILYNTEIKTTNLILFHKEIKTLSKEKVDLSKCLFKKFYSYHSTLNYKGKFYISGGYLTSKMFYNYNKTSNNFIKLEDMPSGHSYHSLIGINNFIFAISGFKNKKVEKYNIDTNQWFSLPSLEISRSWPNSVCFDNKFIYVFGGLCELNNNNLNNQIEKFDISINNNTDNKWELININSSLILPFYSGIVQINNEELIIVGGKIDVKEDDIEECYHYFKNDNLIKKSDDFSLPNKDEFKGNLFIQIEEKKFGQFSSIYNDYFYIIDVENKNIELIKLEENNK